MRVLKNNSYWSRCVHLSRNVYELLYHYAGSILDHIGGYKPSMSLVDVVINLSAIQRPLAHLRIMFAYGLFVGTTSIVAP